MNAPHFTVRLAPGAGGRLIIFDAGTGIVLLGDEISGHGAEMTVPPTAPAALKLTFFFSHAHHDHIQGYPFFKPSFQQPNVFGVLEDAPALRQLDLRNPRTQETP